MDFQLVVGGQDLSSYLVKFERDAKLCQPGVDLVCHMNIDTPSLNTWDTVTLRENGVLTLTGYLMAIRKLNDPSDSGFVLECADNWIRAIRAWNVTNNRKSSGESVKTWISTLLSEAGLSVIYNQGSDYQVIPDYPIPIASYADLVLDLLKFGGWYARCNPDGVIEVGKFGDVPAGTQIGAVGSTPAVPLDNLTRLEHRYDDMTYRNVVKVYYIGGTVIKSDTNLFPGPDRITVLDTNFSDETVPTRLANEIFNTFYQPRLISNAEMIAKPELRVGYNAYVNQNGIADMSQITALTTRFNSQDGYTQSVSIGELCPKFFGIGPFGWSSGSNGNCIPGVTCPEPPIEPPICSPYELWHQHVIVAYSDHIWETFNFGGPCYPQADWVDIKGNIEGEVTGFEVLANGTKVAITSSGSSTGYVYGFDTGGYLWTYLGNKQWSRSSSAQELADANKLWSRLPFDEDGTGLHALTVGCGCVGSETQGEIFWSYRARASYLDLIGNHISMNDQLGTVISNCTPMDNGTWLVTILNGVPTMMPANPCVGAGAYALPDVWDKGFGIELASIVPGHFTPYPNEDYHHFDIRFNVGFRPPDLFFDGQPVSLTGPHVTDWQSNLWMWNSGIIYRWSPKACCDPTHFNFFSDPIWYFSCNDPADPSDCWHTRIHPPSTQVPNPALLLESPKVLAHTTTNANFIGAGTNQGYWTTDDSGLRWTKRLTTTLVKAAAVSSVSGFHYVGGIENGIGYIYTSLDGGSSWGRVISTGVYNKISDLTTHPTDGSTAYAATFHNGVLKTVDAGLNWNSINGNLPLTAGSSVYTAFAVAVDSVDPNILLASTPTGVYRTADGGNHWTLVSLQIARQFKIQYPSPYPGDPFFQEAYFATDNNGIFKSTDTGQTWFAVNNGLSTGRNEKYTIEISPGGEVLAGISNIADVSGLYRSDDRGSSWVLQTNAPTSVGGTARSVNSIVWPVQPGLVTGPTLGLEMGDYYKVFISPSLDTLVPPGQIANGYYTINVANNASTVYAAGNYFIYKSLDYGVTWSALTFPEGDAENIWTLEGEADRMYVTHGIRGDLYISSGGAWDRRFAAGSSVFGGRHSIGIWVDRSS